MSIGENLKKPVTSIAAGGMGTTVGLLDGTVSKLVNHAFAAISNANANLLFGHYNYFFKDHIIPAGSQIICNLNNSGCFSIPYPEMHQRVLDHMSYVNDFSDVRQIALAGVVLLSAALLGSGTFRRIRQAANKRNLL